MNHLNKPQVLIFLHLIFFPKQYLSLAIYTARDNLLFLQGWFSRFPMYRSSDFFITGESYAGSKFFCQVISIFILNVVLINNSLLFSGHFAPQLAELILQTKANIRLKGIAVSLNSEYFL